jgi:hypothetical protein
MSARGFELAFAYLSLERAELVKASLSEENGVTAEVVPEVGALPEVVQLAAVVPMNAAILLRVVNKAILDWKRHGMVIDARGEGPAVIQERRGLPFGTVLTLTRDRDTVTRTDIPEEKLGGYVSSVVQAINGGASASEADTAALADH